MVKKLKSIETIENDALRKGFNVKKVGTQISFYNNDFCGIIVSGMFSLFDNYINVEKIKKNDKHLHETSMKKVYDYFCYKNDSSSFFWYFRNEWFEFDDILPDNLFEI